MKHQVQWVMGATVLIIIAFIASAGCLFLQPQSPPSPAVTSGDEPLPEQTPERTVEQTCAVFGGAICPPEQVCDGTMVRSSDSSRCCEGTCIVPARTTAPGTTKAPTTQATQATATTTPAVTSTVTAVPPDYIPPPPEGPTPGVTQAVQTPEAQVPMDCSSFGGHICLSDETCSGSLVQSSDSSRCCAGTCTMIASPTAVPTTSAPIVIPGKTCSEFGGNICVAPQTCDGSLVTTTDTTQCCAGSCA